jgi:HrpA-like RNA helicase
MIANDAVLVQAGGVTSIDSSLDDLAYDSDGEDTNPGLPADPELMKVAVVVPIKPESTTQMAKSFSAASSATDERAHPMAMPKNPDQPYAGGRNREAKQAAEIYSKSEATKSSEWFFHNPKLYLVRYAQQSSVELNWQRAEHGPPHRRRFFSSLTVPRQGGGENFHELASCRTKKQADAIVALAICRKLVAANLLQDPSAEKTAAWAAKKSKTKAAVRRTETDQALETGMRVMRTTDTRRMLVPHQKGLRECCQQHALPGPLKIDFSTGMIEQLQNLAKLAVPKSKKVRSCAGAAAVFSKIYHGNPSMAPLVDSRSWPKIESGSAPSAFDTSLNWTSKLQLPIYAKQNDITQTIRDSQVVLVTGDPGSGMSTQVVQYVMNDWENSGHGGACSVVQCVSHDVVAVALAHYIAQDRCEAVGKHVGYHTQQAHMAPAQSSCPRAIISTYEILMRRLEHDPFMADASHIILDDIENRSLLADVVLCIQRSMMPRRSAFRVVILGTGDNEHQAHMERYFTGMHTVRIEQSAPLVRCHYAEEALATTGWLPGRQADESTASAMAVLRTEPAVQLSLVTALIAHLVTNTVDGGILIFLPSVEVVATLTKTLQTTLPYSDTGRFFVAPLHPNLALHELQAVFAKSDFGVRKIIVASSIAETSVTVPDVVYVIDGGRSQSTVVDSVSGVASTETIVASQLEMKWRRGRASRCRGGVYYNLLCRSVAIAARRSALPHIQTTPLEEIILQIHLLKLGDVPSFLALTPDPPSLTAIGTAARLRILYTPQCSFFFSDTHPNSVLCRSTKSVACVESALKELRELRALSPDEGELTILGRFLARLQTHPRLGMILLYGTLFGIRDEALTIAAALLVRSPLVLPKEEEQPTATAAHRALGGTNACSDHHCTIAAFSQWQTICDSRGQGAAAEYCQAHYLSESNLRGIANMRKLLAGALDETAVTALPCTPLVTAASKTAAINQMVRVTMSAALAPCIVSVYEKDDGRAGFRTLTNCRMLVHPSSVNSTRMYSDFSTPWVVFYDVVKLQARSQILVQHTTVANAMSLLLLGTGAPWTRVHTPAGIEAMIHSWVRFHFPARESLDLLCSLRDHLDAALTKILIKCEEKCAPDEYEIRVFNIAFSVLNSF